MLLTPYLSLQGFSVTFFTLYLSTGTAACPPPPPSATPRGPRRAPLRAVPVPVPARLPTAQPAPSPLPLPHSCGVEMGGGEYVAGREV